MSSKHFVKTEFALLSLVAVCLLFGCSSKLGENEIEINNPNSSASSSSNIGNAESSSSYTSGNNGASSSSGTGGDGTPSSSDTGGIGTTPSSSDTDGNNDTSSSSGISSDSGASSSSRTSSSGGVSSSSRTSSSSGVSSSSRASSSSGVSSSSRTSSSSGTSSATSSSSLSAGDGTIDCSRAGLTAAVDSYLAALKAGDSSLMPLASAAKYNEYDNASKQDYRTGSVTPTVSKFGEGLWKKPRTVDFHRNLIDVTACASFSEVIINKDSKDTSDPPYVIGVRLNVSGGQISEVHVLATSTGDWAFTASGYYRYSTGEDWGELPVNQHLTRERLKSDAEAYFKYFRDKTFTVPWGTRCARLEGGAYTGDGPNASCNVGVPDLTMDLPTIWWLADVDYGMVVLFVYFGGADTHLFRILPTGYRYIHTLTAMKQSDYQPPK